MTEGASHAVSYRKGTPGFGIHRCERPEVGMCWVCGKSRAEASVVGWSERNRSGSWSWRGGQGPGHVGHLGFILNVMDSPGGAVT